jgi:hypothetical protein
LKQASRLCEAPFKLAKRAGVKKKKGSVVLRERLNGVKDKEDRKPAPCSKLRALRLSWEFQKNCVLTFLAVYFKLFIFLLPAESQTTFRGGNLGGF